MDASPFDTSVDMSSDAPLVDCGRDEFTSLAAWMPITNTNPGVFISINADTLFIEIESVASTTPERLVRSSTLSLRGARVSVELAQTVTSDVVTSFALEAGGNAIYRVDVDREAITFRVLGQSALVLNYQPEHRFLRLRHDPADDTIAFETSNGGTFTSHGTRPAGVLDDLRVVFAGAGSSTAFATTSARWDQLRYECTP